MLSFTPEKLSGSQDTTSVLVQLLSLALALGRKGFAFRWYPEHLLLDSNLNQAYLAGFTPVRVASRFERHQLSAEFLKSLRIFASSRGSENETPVRILRKWERHRGKQLFGCLAEFLQRRPVQSTTITSFEIPRSRELEIVTGLYQLSERSTGKAVIFYGDYGEGKTTFLQQIECKLSQKQTWLSKFESPASLQSYGAARKWIDEIFENLDAYKLWKADLVAAGWNDFLEGSTMVKDDIISATFFQILNRKRKAGQTFTFLIDDVDRFDPESLRLLSTILQYIEHHPVLFVLTASKRVQLQDHVISVSFEPFPPRMSHDACYVPLWKSEQKHLYLRQIYEHAAGNPLLFRMFLKQILSEKENHAIWQDHQWFLPDQIISSYSNSVASLYADLLAQLSEKEEFLLKNASIQGKSFDAGLLPIDQAVDEVLTSLQKKGILNKENGKCKFRQPILADMFYQQIDTQTRIALHLQLAKTMIGRNIPKSGADIARHLLRSGEVNQALEYACKAAAEKGVRTDDVLDVLNELEKCMDELSSNDRARLLGQKAALLFRKGRYPAAAETYFKVRELALTDRETGFENSVRWAQSLFLNNEILSAQKALNEEEKLLPQIKNSRMLISFYFTRGLCSWYRGERQIEDFEKAFALAESCQDYDALAAGYRHRAELALREGSLREAEDSARMVLKYANKVANHEETGCALRVLGSLAWRQSNHKKAVRIFKQSIRAFQKIDHLYGIAVVWSLVGNVHVEQYRFKEAMSAFQKAATLFNKLDHPHEVSLAQFNKGLIYIEQGRLSSAERIFLRCRLIDKKAGNKRYYAYDLRALAVVSMLRGFHRKAERLLRRTLQICEELHAEGDVLQTNLILLFSELEQKNFRKAQPLIEFFEKRMETLQEPMIKSEVHYLFGHYYGYLNEREKALHHIEKSLRMSKEIRYYKLSGMNLILELIFRNTLPPRNDCNLSLAIRLLRRSGNEIALSDYLLKLYQAYPALLKQKQHALWLPKMQRLYRRIKHAGKHRMVHQLTHLVSMEKDSAEELFEWWNGLLQMFQAPQDLEVNLEKVLGRLTGDVKASASTLRFRQASGEMQFISFPQNRNGSESAEFHEKIWNRLLSARQSLCLEMSDFPELSGSGWVTEHQVTSILAVPILSSTEAFGMWYFERWAPQPAFTRKDLNRIAFFCTASSPLLENAIYLDYKKQTRNSQIPAYSFANFIGRSKGMQEIYRQMMRLASLEISVLILGESGTGKELVAKALHNHSPRSAFPFLAVNCSAIPETLIESELFGYNRGAFTGAVATKPGMVERAHKGTLFLDEVGDLSSATQAKLLRVMQEREIQRLGDTTARKVDVRFLFATHKDLKKMVREELYREDLYYRITVYTLTIPPLRDRKEDIPELVSFFLQKFCQLFRKEKIALSPSALRILIEYSWPGNVRELENLVQSLLVNCESNSSIEPSDLPPQITGARSFQKFSGLSLDEAKQEFEKEFLMQALLRNRWNKTHTARDLRITRQGLINMIQRLRLHQPE